MSKRTMVSMASTARVLLIGLDPWGAIAAADLASAGVGAIHLLDGERVDTGDLAGSPALSTADLGAPRAEVIAAAIGAASPRCEVSAGALMDDDRGAIAAPEARFDLVMVAAPADDLWTAQRAARLAHRRGVMSLTAYLDGLTAEIGPAVVPGETACWECARQRLLHNSPRPEIERAQASALLARRPPRRARTYLPSMPAAAGHLFALAALDLLERGASSPLAGRLASHNLMTLESSLHTVLPLNHCEVCGGAAPRWNSGAPPQGNTRDLDDARDPAELLSMLAGVVDARTGIVRRVIVRPSQSARDPEMPVTASALLARGAEHGCDHHHHEPELGAGKGTTVTRAMISAVGEAVERYSAGRFDPAEVVRATVAEMEGDVLTPADLGLYADHQYDEYRIPYPRLGPDTPLDWVRGAWIDTGSPVWVPALPTYMDYPAPPEAYFCEVTSNGLAAGPTLEAAALGAALELVERDAFMISWLARLPGARVILDDSIDPAAREAARELTDLGVRVELYRLDVGTQIPTLLCVGYGDGERWPGATLSLSAHLDPRVAVAKALLEQGHLGPFVCRLAFVDQRPIPASPDEVRTMEDHALYYVPQERARAFAFLDRGPTVAAADLPLPKAVSLDTLTARLTRARLRIAVVDVTSPDLAGTPFRVARALGAGFQQIHFGHHRARLGGARLRSFCPLGHNPDPHPLA